MGRIWTFLWLFVAFFSTLSAQTDRNDQAWRDRIQTRNATEIAEFAPFTLVSGPDLSQFAKEISFLKIDQNELQRLTTEQPNDLRIVLPMINGGRMELDLFPSGILADDFNVWTPDGADKKGVKKYPIKDKGLHYWGAIAGQPNTTAAFSFYKDQVFGVVMTPTGNYNIGILNNEKAGDINALYALFNDSDLTSKNPFSCNVGDAPAKMKLDHVLPMASTTCKVVRIYFEADKHLHDNKGGVANAQAYIAGFFNVVGVIFANENITLELGDIKIWDTTDPYVSFTTTNQFLTEFRNNQIPPNPFTWNLAHLVSARLNIGGLAYLDVLCSNNRGLRSGFSAIRTTFQQLPTYSWTINVVSHELGHNFSSPHTHNCGWPGGAIDGCEAVEGGCTRPPNANPGTIMSYCHIPTSVNLNLGFGTMPGNRIRRAYQNAACLGTTTVTATITSPANPFNLCQGNNVTLTAQSCTGCSYQWRRNGTNIGGATNATYTTNLEGTYTVEVRKYACRAVSEPVSVIIVLPPCSPNNGSVSGGTSLACVSAPAGSVTLSGHTGTVTRWESSTDNFATITNINSTSNTINYPVINQTTCFRAVINNGGTTYSSPHCIVIASPPTVNAGLDAVTRCQGSTGTLWANSTNAISYSWQPATGINNPNISHPIITFAVSTTYTVVVTDNNGCTTSAGVAVTLDATAGEASVANGNLCIGDQAILTLAPPINGTITWQQRLNCTGTWVTATGSGVNTPNFTSDAYTVSGSMCYRAQVVQGGCTYTSNVVTVTICGDVRFTCNNLTYTQNFDNWNPSTPTASTCFGGNGIGWVDDYSIPGFYVASARGSLNINTRELPNCVAWGIINLGINGSTDRALGTMTRSNIPDNQLGVIGVKCRNNTGGNITSVALNYVVEQWMRNPNNGLPTDRLDFQYSLDATALTNGTWVDFNALDAVSPQITNGFGLNGNLPANRANVSGTINALNIPNGATFWLRWVDFDQRPLDWQDALGVEDLNITVTFNGGLTAPTSVSGPVEHCANENQTYTVSPVTGSGTVRYNWTIPGGCTGWSLQSPNNTSSTTMVIRAGSANCSGVTVSATDDCGTSAPYNFNINLGPCLVSVGGDVTPSQTVCNGNAPSILALANHVGNVLRWESSTNCPAFTSPTTINHTNTTYNPGVLTQNTCFRAVVQNGNNPEAISSVATITIAQSGVAGSVGVDQTVCAGENVILNLTGQSGTIVRWESSTDNFVTVTTINNVTATHSFTASTPSRRFRAVIQNAPCPAQFATSAEVLINVCGQNGGNVTADQTICTGNPANTLTLNGHSGSVIRWESSTDNFNSVTTINNTNTTHNPGVLTENTCFRAVVQEINLPVAVSTPACITLTNAPSGGSVNAPMTVCRNVNTGTLTLTGHVGNVLNWEFSTDNFVTFSTINNVTTTHIFNNLTITTWFRARVQNPGCPAVLSSSVQITVVNAPLGGNVTADQTVCPNVNAATLRLANFAGNIVRWESSTDDFTTIATIANTTNLLNPGVIHQTTKFRAVVQNTCSTVVSTSVTLTSLQGSGGTLSQDMTICNTPASGTLNLTGYSGVIMAWEGSTDNFITVQPYGIQTPNFTFTNLTTTTKFRVRIKEGNCVFYSNSVTITVLPAPKGGFLFSNQTICEGQNASMLVLSSFVGNIIRWESSTDNFALNVQTINNTLPLYNPNPVNQTTAYRVVVNRTGCTEVLSATATITMGNGVSGGSVTSDQTVCTGQLPNLLTLSGQQGAVLYWESSTDNFATTVVINNTNSTYQPPLINVATSYRAVIKGDACGNAYSTPATITITQGAEGGILSADQTICSGNMGGILLLTNYVGNIVRWESSTDNFALNVQTINNTLDSYNPGVMNVSMWYRAVVSQAGCNEVQSNAVRITVIQGPNGGTLLQDQTICSGGSPNNLTLTMFSGTIVQWESSTDNFTTVTVIPNTNAIYNPGVLVQTTSYRVKVSSGNCPDVYSNPITITVVNNIAQGGNVTADRTLCSNDNNVYTLTLSGQVGPIIRWEASEDNFMSVSTFANTNTTHDYSRLRATTKFRAVVGVTGCDLVYSTPATITVLSYQENGILTNLGNGQLGCSNNTGTLTLNNYVGTIVRWESSTDNFTTITNIPNVNNTHAYTVSQPTQFRVVVNHPVCGEVFSPSVVVTPGITLNVNAWRECNATGKIVAVASGGTSPYVYSITPISGQQSQTGIFTGLALGTYTITVRDRFNCTATATIAIPGTVTPPRITNIIPVGNTSARVIWDVVMPGGVNVLYQLQHRPVGSPTWSAPIQYNTNVVTVSGLIPNTQYEVQVRVRCLPSTLWGDWSSSMLFQTLIRDESSMITGNDHSINMEVYPNPNKGDFNVRITKPSFEPVEISIFDVTGRIIYSRQTEVDELLIQLPEASAGLYTIKVVCGDVVRFSKMIIDR